MEKKVGNILLLFLLLVSPSIFASEQAIVMQIQDMNHEPISQAMSQVPFILQVELQNLEGYTDTHVMQNIFGIEKFKLIKTMTSQNISIYNGKKIAKVLYSFILSSDKQGTFKVGPLSLKNRSNKVIQSNHLMINVGDELLFLRETDTSNYFITVELDKKQAYVGEKISLSIKFYDFVSVDDLHLEFPEFKKLHIFKTQDSFKKSVVEIDDKECVLFEWTFDVYPAEPGTLIFQDMYAAFSSPKVENKFGLGAFDFFKAFHKSIEHIAAKPVKVEVLSLPYSEKFSSVVAVGKFLQYNFRCHQDSACVGQGVTLTIELLGDGNFEMIPFPELVLPKGFKYYDSNMTTVDAKRHSKQYECIIQAEQPGSYRIEPQKLVYFDHIAKQYCILESNEFNITITPALDEKLPLQKFNQLDDEADTSQNSIFPTQELTDFTLIEDGLIHAVPSLVIPFYQFQKIIWLLLFIWFSLLLYVYFIKKYFLEYPFYKKMVTFYQVKKMYKSALAKQNIALLKIIFDQLFARLLGVSVGQLSDAMIFNYVKSKNFSDDLLFDWSLFYKEMLETSFSLQTDIDRQNLFVHALQWIERLKEKA